MSPAMTNATVTLTTEAEGLMSTLCDLLDRESSAVQASDFKVFRAIQSDKFAMLTRYRALMDTLHHQSETMAGANAIITDRLKDSAVKFKASLSRNAQTLEAGKQSTQRILDRIVRSAREQVHGTRQTYTKKGHTNEVQSPLSIQINEVL